MKSLIHFIELGLVLAILIAVGIPLFSRLPLRKAFEEPEKDRDEYRHLLVRREETLLSIKDLEFDRETDKISGEDYEILRKKLEEEALAVLDRIDAMEKIHKKGNSESKEIDAAKS